MPGASARFVIHQFRDGSRSFGSELGVAGTPRLDLFPDAYLDAEHVHLGTAPPQQQLTWLRFLRDRGSAARISVDMFEYFVETEPHASREACELADLLFMNEAEYAGLYSADIYPKAPVVLKRGAAGAELVRDGMRHHVRAPVVHEVDPIGAGRCSQEYCSRCMPVVCPKNTHCVMLSPPRPVLLPNSGWMARCSQPSSFASGRKSAGADARAGLAGARRAPVR